MEDKKRFLPLGVCGVLVVPSYEQRLHLPIIGECIQGSVAGE